MPKQYYAYNNMCWKSC